MAYINRTGKRKVTDFHAALAPELVENLRASADIRKPKYGPKGIRPSGRILAHNHVRHYAEMPNGLNGFRFWYDWPPGSRKKSRPFGDIDGGKLPDYIVCKCGWRPDLGVHYRIRGMGSANYRVDTFETIMKF
jgi:hypothetical protein